MIIAAEAASVRARLRAALVRSVWLDIGLAGLIVVAACLARLPTLDDYTSSDDEGIRAQQLLLMAAGYRPCGEIFCNQGPLLLYTLYPTFLLFGQTLEAVRSGVVLFSLLGLVGMYWVGYLVAGRPAAMVSALLVGLSPTYLRYSRLAFSEVPALALAILAVGAALVFQRAGRDRWLLTTGVLVACSWLLKPVTLAVFVPVGLLILLRPVRRWRNLAVLLAVTSATITLAILLVGFSEMLEQVLFRVRSRVAEGLRPPPRGGGIGGNWVLILNELRIDAAGIFMFATAGTLVLLARLRWVALPLVAWAPASLLLLLVHTPVHPKYVVTLIPPLALLAGTAVGIAWLAAREQSRGATRNRWMVWLSIVVTAVGATAYLLSLPSVLAQDRQMILNQTQYDDRAKYWYRDVVSTLRSITDERDVIVTDFPYIPFEARRLVPPPLVESSGIRIRAQSLTDYDAIQHATRYGTAAVLLWSNRLTGLTGFKAWVDRTYVPIRVYAVDGRLTPTLYVRPEQVELARSVLEPRTPTRLGSTFDGGVRLTAFGLDRDRLRPGDATAVNLAWEAPSPPSTDYQMILRLWGGEQVVWQSDALPLAGLGPGSASWTPGQGVSLSALIRLPRSTKPGTYSLSVQLFDPRAQQLPGPTVDGNETGHVHPKGMTLATLTVLQPTAR